MIRVDFINQRVKDEIGFHKSKTKGWERNKVKSNVKGSRNSQSTIINYVYLELK